MNRITSLCALGVTIAVATVPYEAMAANEMPYYAREDLATVTYIVVNYAGYREDAGDALIVPTTLDGDFTQVDITCQTDEVCTGVIFFA